MSSHRKTQLGKFLLVLFALASVLTTAAFAESGEAVSSFYGTIWSLLPPVVAIILALITKEVYSSLFIGILVGFVLQSNFDPVMTFDNLVNGFIGNIGGNAGILIFLVILGTLVALMIRAGGSKAYGDWAVSHIKTKAGALWSTFILAIVLGVDDYFNNLTTGNVMRPVADSHHISRAKLAYMCDATAAPVCIMMPISSWAAAVTGVINNEELGFQIFLRAIPYNYYAVLTMVFIILMTALNIDYGPMKTHEDNAAKGDLYTTPERPYADATEMKFNPNGKVIDLILPVLILIICCVGGLLYAGWLGGGTTIITMFANTDAFFGLPFGATIAIIIDLIYFAARRSMSFTELMDCLPEGFKQMVPAILILCMAWTISGVTRDGLGAPEFVADFVKQLGPGLHNFLPAVVFIIACFLGFATGTSWGTFGILLPIVLEIFTPGGFDNLTAEALNEVPILMVGIGATLGGAVMGDHCSPISDTTIMASTGAQCYHLNHVATQMPYAVTVALIAFVNYIIDGMIIDYVPQVVCLAIAIASTVVVMLVIGKMNHSMNAHSQRD